MKLWEKIRSSFGEGVEAISEKTAEFSNFTKLKWEQLKIQRAIDKEFNELGGKVYQLHVDKREDQLKSVANDPVQKLKTLEEQLKAKEKEINELKDKETIDRKQLKEFQKDLEKVGGAIEQVVIKHDSPFIGKKLMDMKFPKNVLVGTIVRNDQVMIPDGQTKFLHGDKVTLLGEKDDVQEALQMISSNA